MNYAAAQFTLNIVITLVNLGIAIYAYRTNREKVTSSRFKVLEDRMVKAETRLKSMPVCGNHDRMETNDVKLFERFDDLHGDIRELVGSMKGLTNQMGLVNEHLLRGGK